MGAVFAFVLIMLTLLGITSASVAYELNEIVKQFRKMMEDKNK